MESIRKTARTLFRTYILAGVVSELLFITVVLLLYRLFKEVNQLLAGRSGFLPRFLGVWLIINGLAYLVISMTGLLLPQYVHTMFLIAQPALMGELVLTLWLLIVGARVQPARQPVAV